MNAPTDERRSYRTQVIGSLIAAFLIVVLVVAVVTANLGRGTTRESYEEREDVIEERQELEEERREEEAD